MNTLSSELCGPAAEAWVGDLDRRYHPGYLWQFENGTPGTAVRAFVCTVTLSGHSPFTGTLRHPTT
ncbi:hypothetical protein [Actinokineospora enzanensis]|uniref:hypothetical protein n=1 Tax=Actinokineospora enzanensis TaxID=155975 RepID=UPI000369188D|nr:hypothetical protein [Actinokineospora enzanensis]